MKTKKIKLLVTALVVVVLANSLLYAPIGLGMKFATLVLEKLTPGGVYNISKLRNIPIIVINTGTGETGVVMRAEAPPDKDLREGYKPIPDPTWIKFMPEKFTLQRQGDKYYVDLVLNIPDDKNLIGQHYQATISAMTDAHGMYATGVAQKFFFSIGVDGPEAVRIARQKKILMELDFETSPDRMYLQIQPGKKIDVYKELKKTIKLVNKGSTKLKVKLESVPNERGYPIEQGYEITPSTGAIRFVPEIYKVGINSIKDTRMFIEVPDNEEWKRKKYMFLIKTTPIEPELPVELYNMIYVTIKE